MQVSFETPEYTANADALGTLRLLEAIRILGRMTETRFYQASTSELYGGFRESAAGNHAIFIPARPMRAAKLYAYWITVNYREAYGLSASNGILFNHEAPCGVKPSSPAKSPARSPRSNLDCKNVFISAISMPSVIGAMRAISPRHVADAAAAGAR